MKISFCLQELLVSVGSLELPAGKAEISDVSKCVGDVSFLAILCLYQLYGFLKLQLLIGNHAFWTLIVEFHFCCGQLIAFLVYE